METKKCSRCKKVKESEVKPTGGFYSVCKDCRTIRRDGYSKKKPSLLDEFPELVEQWDYQRNDILPEDCSKGSERRVWWRCDEGKCGQHFWEAMIYTRTGKKANGCPFCSNRRICPCFCNSLLVTATDKTREIWDGERNGGMENYFGGSTKKVWWKCNKGLCGNLHRWQSTINNVTYGNGCPICTNHKICSCFCNSLLITATDRVREIWDGERNGGMENYSPCSSSKKISWKCNKGICGNPHRWYSPISDIVNGNGCPICTNQKICPCFCNSLLATATDRVREIWDGERNGGMEHYFTKSNKKVWWKCSNKKCNAKWEAVISSVVGMETDCPTCHCSKLEKEARSALTLFNIEFEEQKKFNCCQNITHLRFDFFISNNNLRIELQGGQHFKRVPFFHRSEQAFPNQQHKDNIKMISTNKANSSLLTISYLCKNTISSILQETFSIDTSNTKRLFSFYISPSVYIRKTFYKDGTRKITFSPKKFLKAHETFSEEQLEIFNTYKRLIKLLKNI